MGLENKVCSECGSKNLDKGNLLFEYSIAGILVYQLGKPFSSSSVLDIDVYACLDCGYIGIYLKDKELSKLRLYKTKQAEKKK